MSNTAVCKFCTLKEAAERLDATEDQIEGLLRKGVLREFRIGSHRLLRTADVGAIVAARNRRLERQGRQRMPRTTRPSPPERDGGPPVGPVDAIGVPRSPGAASQTPQRNVPRLTTANEVRRQKGLGSRPPARRPAPATSGPSHALSGDPRLLQRRTPVEALSPRPSASIREWFWTGLIQDRPETIALLSGLVLLALSAVVAGVLVLTDMR